MQAQTVISSRFNGPPTSGNGGYSCGVLAAHIEGAARIRLHVPPPLDRPLRITDHEGGVAMFDEDTLVATGAATKLELDVPTAPTYEQALDAMKLYASYADHAFPTCFVCGPGREACDGLEIYPGAVAGEGAHILACVWQPREDMQNAQGNVLPEIVWAALDCPGYFAAMEGNLRPALLGELTGELHRDFAGSKPLIVYSWPLGGEGRKYYGGTAITTQSGELLASSKSTWIELKS